MRHAIALNVFAVALLAACSSSGASTADTEPVQQSTSAPVASTADFTTTPTLSAAPSTSTTTSTTTTSTTTTSTTSTSTSTSTTSTTTTTLPAGTVAGALDFAAEELVLGTSVEGRPITAERRGTAGGYRIVVFGVIHGDEDDGVQIIDDLREREIPDGIELWLVESMNPDGQAAQDRHNANQVDLNRNFPYKWGVIGEPGNSQYAGPAPASEPETQAVVRFINELRPDVTIWYHQDANRVLPSTGRDGRVRARYAELSGLIVADCCDGGTYTGIAATWARNELQASDAVAFIVELPADVTDTQAATHAAAVVAIANEERAFVLAGD